MRFIVNIIRVKSVTSSTHLVKQQIQKKRNKFMSENLEGSLKCDTIASRIILRRIANKIINLKA